MIDLELILSRLEEALRVIDAAGGAGEDERLDVAEMIMELHMQLDMVGEEAHRRYADRLAALESQAARHGIRWLPD